MRYLNTFIYLVIGLLLVLSVPICAAEAKKDEQPPMSILPAPKTMTIDGDLKEWNLSGKIGPVSFDEEVADEYNITCYAMYDKKNIYLAVKVVESHPPYNTYPYKGRYDWVGDDVNIRMSTRPKDPASWPLQFTDLPKTHELWNGKFWWNHKHKATLWQGYRGMDMCSDVFDKKGLPGFYAATKLAKDGHGYTMEIKMPWAF